MVGVAPFVLMGVFSSTMQLRGRPGLEYSDAGLRGAIGRERDGGQRQRRPRRKGKAMINQWKNERKSIRKYKRIEKRKSYLQTQTAENQ